MRPNRLGCHKIFARCVINTNEEEEMCHVWAHWAQLTMIMMRVKQSIFCWHSYLSICRAFHWFTRRKNAKHNNHRIKSIGNFLFVRTIRNGWVIVFSVIEHHFHHHLASVFSRLDTLNFHSFSRHTFINSMNLTFPFHPILTTNKTAFDDISTVDLDTQIAWKYSFRFRYDLGGNFLRFNAWTLSIEQKCSVFSIVSNIFHRTGH